MNEWTFGDQCDFNYGVICCEHYNLYAQVLSAKRKDCNLSLTGSLVVVDFLFAADFMSF